MKVQQHEPTRSDLPPGRYSAFPRTPVLVTLPQSLGQPGPLRGELLGVWRVVRTSRRTVCVAGFEAILDLPSVLIAGPGRKRLRARTLRIPVRLGAFSVPPALATDLPLNVGVVDPRSRLVRTTLGLELELPDGIGLTGPAPLLMHTFGHVGRDGTQIGGGTGVVFLGALAGTILCCAGGREFRPPPLPPAPEEPETPPPAAPGPMVSDTHIRVERDVGEKGRNARQPPLVPPIQRDSAKAQLGWCIKVAQRGGVFDAVNRQLARDGLPPIRIRLFVNVRNGLQASLGLGGITQCGDPIEIMLDADVCNNQDMLVQALAHELVHAKECAYAAVGLPLPYGGHDTDLFNAKAAEFERLIREQLEKDTQHDRDEMEKFLEEHGAGH